MGHRWDTCFKCEGTGMAEPYWEDWMYDYGSPTDHCSCHCHAGNTTCPTCDKVVKMWERFKSEGLGDGP